MKANAKIVIEEDTVTEYLEYISTTLHETAGRELKKQARLLTGDEEDDSSGFIPKHMSTEFNPNLFISGQEEEYWKLYSQSNPHNLMGGKNASSIEIMYTGMRLHETYKPGVAKVWSEFGEEGEQYKLERDYAYFQETGLDPIANSKYAKHKGAIAKGVRESKHTLLDHSARYLESIMKRGGGDIPPTLI